MDADIGYTIFVDILKITTYPAGFRGNIIEDLIMFFFIPMVFVVLFIYILLGRIVYGVKWLRALLGIAIFLFMVINGLFATFAILSGPYFYFLIVILGALYFLPSHFGARAAGMPRSGSDIASTGTTMTLAQINREMDLIDSMIKDAKARQAKGAVIDREIQGLNDRYLDLARMSETRKLDMNRLARIQTDLRSLQEAHLRMSRKR